MKNTDIIGSYTKSMNLFDPTQDKYPSKQYDIVTFFHNYRNLLGIEVEVESTGGQQTSPNLIYWNLVADGSLKQNGREYVSHPIGGKNIDYALHELSKNLPKNILWSHRTSIHVHSDIRHLRIWQLDALISYYAMFENAFFSLVAAHRKGNSYCYPIADLDTGVTFTNGQDLKYCAFNPGSAMYHGTVEWRHMEGNGDFIRIRRWIQLICKLQKWVESKTRNDLKSIMLTTCNNSSYEQLAKEIFGNSMIAFGNFNFKEECDKTIKWAILNLEKGI